MFWHRLLQYQHHCKFRKKWQNYLFRVNSNSYKLATAVKYMLRKKFLHNDIKAKNVLLKLKEGNWIPKLTGIGKVTLKLEPEVYCLSASQTEKYKNILI